MADSSIVPRDMPALRRGCSFQVIMMFVSIFVVVLIAMLSVVQIGHSDSAVYAKLEKRDDISTNNDEGTLHRRSYFYVGGEYRSVSGQNSAISFGQMYVEHLVPSKVTQPFPIVFLPGNGRVE